MSPSALGLGRRCEGQECCVQDEADQEPPKARLTVGGKLLLKTLRRIEPPRSALSRLTTRVLVGANNSPSSQPASADLYGPDIPLMVGITRRQPAKSVTVWRNPRHRPPIEPLERFGIKVVFTQFLVAEDRP